MEELAMIHAIQEGEETEPARREELFMTWTATKKPISQAFSPARGRHAKG